MSAHVDIARAVTPHRLREGLNALVRPLPVSVLAVEPVTDDWHARVSCTGRRYLYRILNRRAPPALEQGRVWHVKKALEHEAMHAAAQRLVGRHDFTTFRDAHCQARSPVKTLDEARVWREGGEVHLAFASRSFLHRQVRSMVGSLVEVGTGRWSADQLQAALEACDRRRCGQVAPAQGLYLTAVEYGGPPPASLEDAEDEEDE
jgi:tRNA pseudouridine38-40 synthase